MTKILGTMIIVKTSNGDELFNDKEILRLRHDKENHFVYVSSKSETSKFGIHAIHDDMTVDQVESVIYINDATGTERKDDGSEVKFLRQQLADEKNLSSFMHTMAKQLESHISKLANDIIYEVNYGGEGIVPPIRERLRERAEESKEYSLDDSKWWERRQYMEIHQQQAEAEAARTAELNEKVEQQAFRILELEAIVDQTKRRLKISETENKSLHEYNNALENRNLWQRIFNLIP